MSILGKKWIIKNQDADKTLFEKLLANRNLDELNELEDFHDPFLFEDMAKSVKRILQAVKDHERIIIFGDYDVDGISGTALLVHALRRLKANVSFRLPNRVKDGYGLSEKFIDEFIEKDIKILITVDCGISCRRQVLKAAKNDIDVIITDHHTIPEKAPDDAFAIIHPKQTSTKYPFSELTGSGVALKLAHALINTVLPFEEQEDFLTSLVDLASLGTIADLGILQDENRLIVRRGLKALKNTRWAGLKSLKELAKIQDGDDIDASKIGFQIAPRINAAGRIGDPYTALFLLLQEEEGEKANYLGSELERLNKERQEMTEKSMIEAEASIDDKEIPYLIIAHSPDWHVGILGLIAGKLAEKHSRPTIIMQDLGDTLVASARSPKFFNIVEALNHASDHMLSFGGHAQAAGFNMKKENLSAFKKTILEYAESKLKDLDIQATIEIDCELSNQKIDFDLMDEINRLAPFGMGNRRPTFILKNVEALFVDQVGHDKSHLKFSVKIKDRSLGVIAFRMGEYADTLKASGRIDLVCHLDRNRWRDRDRIQLQALDFRLIEE